MLVLSRKRGEGIVIDVSNLPPGLKQIRIIMGKVNENPGYASVCIDAPKEVSITREELLNNERSSQSSYKATNS